MVRESQMRTDTKLSMAAGIAVAFGGFLALIGWVFDVETLRSLAPGLVAMNPITALCFVLAGISLVAWGEGEGRLRRRLGMTTAMAVAATGLVKLASTLFRWGFGIDRLLFPDRLETVGSLPNRMAPNTALNLLFVGLALALLHAGRAFRVTQGLTLLSALVWGLALVGYLFQSRPLYGIHAFIPMALNTALAFFLLCVGILSARRDRGVMRLLQSGTGGGVLARRLLPWAILLPILLGWLRLAGERSGLYSREFGVSLMAASSVAIFTLLVWRSAVLLDRADAKGGQAEEALRRSEARLQAILDHAPAVIYLKDSEGRYLFVNRRFEAAFGSKRQEVVGRTNEEALPGLANGYRSTVLRQEGSSTMELEEVLPQKDGLRTYISSKFLIPEAAVGKEELGSISIDITDRKLAEEEIARFFHLSLDMLCIAGLDGYFKRLNPAWENVLGWTRAQLLEKPFVEFVHPEDRAATVAEAEKVSQGSDTVSFTNRYLCADGSYRWLLWNASPDRQLQRIYAAARDITEKRRSEQEIEQLNTELKQSVAELGVLNRELEAFSYSVSHDLRAPLRHVSGFAELLEKNASSSLDEKSRRFLRTISESAKQMGRLIDDLLAFSRVGRTELNTGRVDLRQLAEEARHELGGEAAGRDVIWKLDSLPEVRGDRALLRLVVVNLLSNAFKYTRPRSRAEIEVGSLPDDGGEEVTVYVRDNGVGFEMQYVDRLFGVFQRLHRAEEFEGTGIGLANVRRIVHRHGGRTWAEGAPDRGATFYFTLPRFEEGEA
jgi:PAS domain S-box-containing protein